MLDFLETPAGMWVFGAFVALVVIALVELNYKLFAKVCLDFLFAMIATVLCSPVLIACAVIGRKRSGSILERKAYLGVGGKVIYLHSFSGTDRKVRYTARLFDILGGRLSFVGIKPLPVEDGAFMDDKDMERFAARPGLLTHLSVTGHAELTFGEMFALDIRYAKKRGLFYDLWVLIRHALVLIRGEGKSFKGETVAEGYAEYLFGKGEINEADLEKARIFAQEAEEEAEKARLFKKERRNR